MRLNLSFRLYCFLSHTAYFPNKYMSPPLLNCYYFNSVCLFFPSDHINLVLTDVHIYMRPTRQQLQGLVLRHPAQYCFLSTKSRLTSRCWLSTSTTYSAAVKSLSSVCWMQIFCIKRVLMFTVSTVHWKTIGISAKLECSKTTFSISIGIATLTG